MKNALLATLAILSLASMVYSQKRSTILGDTFTGEVVSSNEATRELTITYTDKEKNKTATFVGVLKQGYQVSLRDGTRRELQMSEIKPGVRVRVFYKEKSDNVAGEKVKIATIVRIDFVGVDEYTTLREALGVAPSLPVTLATADKLPSSSPLKLYVAIHEPYFKERLIRWVEQWNKEQAPNFGSIEIVPDLAQSDIAAVFFWGAKEWIFSGPLVVRTAEGDDFALYKATLQLVTKDDAGLRVLWLTSIVAGRKLLDSEQGPIERELEKRLKARGKK